jgi:hypothetical protein
MVDHVSPNCKAVLLRDLECFKQEVADNYRAMFHEPIPHRKPSYAVFVWLLELFDRDRQFIHELDAFLEVQKKRANKRVQVTSRKPRRT